MTLCSALVGGSCYDLAKDFATPTIAMSVALVAFFQWRTAQRKIVLDLFQRRYDAYEAMSRALVEVVLHDHVSAETRRLYAQAEHTFGFLFGPDVTDRLAGVRRAILRIPMHQRQIEAGRASDAQHDERHDASVTIATFYEQLPSIVLPYLRFHDKAPRLRVWDRLMD